MQCYPLILGPGKNHGKRCCSYKRNETGSTEKALHGWWNVNIAFPIPVRVIIIYDEIVAKCLVFPVNYNSGWPTQHFFPIINTVRRNVAMDLC